MLTDDETTVRKVVGWWRGLQPDPEKQQPGDRAALARLRRCTSVTEALFEPETQALVQRCGARSDAAMARLALAAAVLAHVRDERREGSVARQVGVSKLADTDQIEALCKPLRFRKLMDAGTYDECLRAFRRLVALAGRKVNVADLTEALLKWPREGARDDGMGEHIRRKWVYAYWNAGQPRSGPENISNV
ncbi:type I-E CRISPR-associated protein Cse2/CasB [Komagataeibacter melomenusus]